MKTQAEWIREAHPGVSLDKLLEMGAGKCEDCGGDFTPENLRASIVGWLCPECLARFQGACEGLARYRNLRWGP